MPGGDSQSAYSISPGRTRGGRDGTTWMTGARTAPADRGKFSL
jgi:hypothetical protein